MVLIAPAIGFASDQPVRHPPNAQNKPNFPHFQPKNQDPPKKTKPNQTQFPPAWRPQTAGVRPQSIGDPRPGKAPNKPNLYFAALTMTTLGFGDIAANPDSICRQLRLMLQVILGYVLLGALVTRFAVLFTAGGPAGKFADEKGMIERARDLVKRRFGRKGIK